jgi:hypothetical protein
MEHFHIAGVGCRAVEDFAGKADAAHFLGAQGIFKVGEARPLEFERLVDMVVRGRLGRHEQVPDAGVLGLGLQILDDLDDLPAIAGLVLLFISGDGGANLALDEIAHPVPPIDLPVGEIEIHARILPFTFT